MKILTVLFGVIIGTNVFCQRNSNVDSLMQIVSEKVNRLPLTISSEIKGREFKTQYFLKWEKSKRRIVLYDKRFLSNTNRKMVASYKDFFLLNDLHPDGICLKYSDDSLSVYLQLFTANNKYSVISKNYMNGFCRSTNYYDRIYFGAWDAKDGISRLIEIQQLLKRCVKCETDWGIEAAPDVSCPINLAQTFKKRRKTVIVKCDKPQVLNSSIANPALFLDAKSEQENRKVIKNYVIQKLSDKKIKYHGDMIGTITVDKFGNVVDFKFIREVSGSVEDEIKKILLSMPQWIPAKLNGNSIEVGQTIAI